MPPPPCTDLCHEGDGLCTDAGVVACEEDGSCNGWGAPTPCAPSEVCVGGACVCADPCVPGQTRCEADRLITCAGPDATGCYAWRPSDVPCPCLLCELGETACGPAGLLRCGGPDADGCTAWLADGCAAEMLCVGGACRCGDPCTEGQSVCEGDAAQRDCVITGGCASWSDAQPCPGELSCYAEVGWCFSETPAACAETNECDYVGQKKCMSETEFGECTTADDGCLAWDCTQ